GDAALEHERELGQAGEPREPRADGPPRRLAGRRPRPILRALGRQRAAAPEHEHLGPRPRARGARRSDRQDAARAVPAEPVDQPDDLTARELAVQAWVIAHAAILEARDRWGNFSAAGAAGPERARPRLAAGGRARSHEA